MNGECTWTPEKCEYCDGKCKYNGVNYVCLPVQCKRGVDCDPGKVCDNGRCTDLDGDYELCLNKYDCRDEEECKNGKCVSIETGCHKTSCRKGKTVIIL